MMFEMTSRIADVVSSLSVSYYFLSQRIALLKELHQFD